MRGRQPHYTAPPMGPEELARYRLKRVLGRGGRPGLIGGEVWEAEDTEHPRRVALKILRVDDEEMLITQARFVRDAQTVAQLKHPNVVAVRDAGEAGGTSFVVMEFVEGKPLTAMIEGASVEKRVEWLRQVAFALVALHEVDVAHRDLKAQNVIIRKDGTACLVDLGVPFDSGDGAPDPKDDQAAWAALAKTVLGDDVPEDLVPVIDRAGAPDRDSRYETMNEVAAALPGGAADAQDPSPVLEARGKTAPKRSLSPWVAVLALAILIALAVIVQRALLD
jgi:serine/threonine protein kinase